MSQSLKGRGAQKHISNRYEAHRHEPLDEYLNFCQIEGENPDPNQTQYIDVHPKTLVNKVTSPDVGMGYSANPYQGCEHGCVYCYARNSHEYWGYGAGLDFERTILVKRDAPQLLEAQLRKTSWQGDTIVFSGNTDCYQPIERKLEITRDCLKVFLKWKHPVGIITKNALVLRDLDLLKELAKDNLVIVNMTLTSLSEDTRRLLEPRTSSVKNRLKTIEILSQNNIPVNVMLAPIIPTLNSHEVLPIIKEVSLRGAKGLAYTVVRLNGQIAALFEDWARKNLPDKAGRMLSQIAECHGGNLNDSRWGKRMKGDGAVAKQIADTVKLGKKQFFEGRKLPKMNRELYLRLKDPQMRLF